MHRMADGEDESEEENIIDDLQKKMTAAQE
jgi:hypothetical protein